MTNISKLNSRTDNPGQKLMAILEKVLFFAFNYFPQCQHFWRLKPPPPQKKKVDLGGGGPLS